MKTFDNYYVIYHNRKYLYLPNNFNESLDDYVFDDDLYLLDFGEDFNQSIDNVIFPPALVSIRVGFNFNQSLSNVKFPDSLLDLSLQGVFNQKINDLSILNTLETIEFGHRYEYSLEDIKFTNLIMITIGNNNVLNTLKFPPLLDTIKFSIGMSIPLSDIKLPDTIKRIIYASDTTSEFDLQNVKLPPSLIKLVLPSFLVVLNINEMTVFQKKYLTWNFFDNLPHTLEELSFRHITRLSNYKKDPNITIDNLPISLKKIFTMPQNFEYFTKLPFGCELCIFE